MCKCGNFEYEGIIGDKKVVYITMSRPLHVGETIEVNSCKEKISDGKEGYTYKEILVNGKIRIKEIKRHVFCRLEDNNILKISEEKLPATLILEII